LWYFASACVGLRPGRRCGRPLLRVSPAQGGKGGCRPVGGSGRRPDPQAVEDFDRRSVGRRADGQRCPGACRRGVDDLATAAGEDKPAVGRVPTQSSNVAGRRPRWRRGRPMARAIARGTTGSARRFDAPAAHRDRGLFQQYSGRSVGGPVAFGEDQIGGELDADFNARVVEVAQDVVDAAGAFASSSEVMTDLMDRKKGLMSGKKWVRLMSLPCREPKSRRGSRDRRTTTMVVRPALTGSRRAGC
jgi:hypothetical protein